MKKILFISVIGLLLMLTLENINVLAKDDIIDFSESHTGYTDYSVAYNGREYERMITYSDVKISIGKTVTIKFKDLDEYNFFDGTINYVDSKYFNIVKNVSKQTITVTAIKAGVTHMDCEYYKYSGLGNIYAMCIARANITIVDDLEITLTSTSKTLNINRKGYLQASINPYELYVNNISTYGNLKWTSSNAACVSISDGNNKGMENIEGENTETLFTTITGGAISLIANKPGTAIITCELAKDSSVKTTCVVTVVDNRISVSGVSLNCDSISLTTSENKTLSATVKPLNATNQKVAWESSDTSVVIVSDGKLYPQTEGVAKVTVKTNDGGYKATCTVKVSNPWNIIINPTANENGLAEKYIGLGRKITKELPKLTDSNFWKEINKVNATCTTEGYAQYESECGTISIILPKNDNHSWNKRSEEDLGNGEVNSYYVCLKCNKTKTKTEPAYLYALDYDNKLIIYGFKYGNNLKGEIHFPSMINGYYVKSVNLDLWATTFNLSNITGLVFDDGIAEIGDGFSCLTNLEYVKLPNSLKIINYNAFKGCTKIKSIEIPGTVTSIGEEAFSGCTSLKNVIIKEGVEEIGVGAFLKCPIEQLVIPKTVTVLEDYCFLSANITEISLPDGLKVLGAAFSNIEYYYIPSSVTSIKSLFEFGDGACKGIYVSKDNLKYSSDEYGVLYNKDKSELLVYPSANEEKTYTIPDNVETIGAVAFGNTERSNLEILSLPASLTTISNSALWKCTNVNKIIFRGTKQAFSEIKVGTNNKILETAEIVYDTDITNISLDKTSLTVYVNESIALNVLITPDYVTNVTWSSSDENLVIVSNGIITAKNAGIATITVSNKEGTVFDSCVITVLEKQKEVVSSPQTSILDTFVKSGTKISLNSSTEGALIYYTIADSDSIDDSDPIENGILYTEEICIEKNVTIKAVAIKENMKNSDVVVFTYSIIEVDNNQWDLNQDGILTILGKGNMNDYPTTSAIPWYSNRLNINKIVVSDGITTIGTKAFYGCINATVVEIPASVTSIGENAFKNCDDISINGVSGSYAQQYATANNIPFKYLSEPLPDLRVEFAETSSRWYFDISQDTYTENAIIYVGIYDEHDKLLAVESEYMVDNDITSVPILKVDNYNYAKIFEWVNMRPVTNSKLIPLN